MCTCWIKVLLSKTINIYKNPDHTFLNSYRIYTTFSRVCNILNLSEHPVAYTYPWLGITALMTAWISENRVSELMTLLCSSPCQTRNQWLPPQSHSAAQETFFCCFSLTFDFTVNEKCFYFMFLYQTHHPQSLQTGIEAHKINTVFTDLQNCPRRLSLILGNKKVYSLGFICTTSSQVRTNEIGLHIVDNRFSGCPSKILFWSWWDYISYRDWDGNLDSVFRVILE